MKIQLDWDLEGIEERKQFVTDYVRAFASDLTPQNLERIAEYLLWSLDDLDDVIIESKGPWRKERKVESLDALYEQEREDGRTVELHFSDTQYKQEKRRIEREVVATRLGSNKEEHLYKEVKGKEKSLHPTAAQWVDLWMQIDEVEYKVQVKEGIEGKRRADLPIRDELIERLERTRRFKEVEFEEYWTTLYEEARHWEWRELLKAKRGLVALRTQQYQLWDGLPEEGIRTRTTASLSPSSRGGLFIGGIYPFTDISMRVEEVTEEWFEKERQGKAVQALARLDALPSTGNDLYIDFRDEKTVRNLISHLNDLFDHLHAVALKNNGGIERIESKERIEEVLDWFDYYIKKAELGEDLQLIFALRRQGKSNREIREALMEQFGREYRENYISTIFSKRIIGAIVKAAEEHERMLNYITMGRTVFKQCSRCRQLKPRNADYFNRRKSTSDGFKTHCKECN